MKNKKLIILLLTVLCFLIVGCDNGNSNNEPLEEETPTTNRISGDIVSAFKQFGMNSEQIKPQLGKENSLLTKNGNLTISDDDTIYFRKATYIETVKDLTSEQRTKYQSEIFDYTKFIADDGKNYYCSDCANWEEEKISINNNVDSENGDYKWSYIYDQKIIDIYVQGVISGDQIGIKVELGQQIH